MSVLDLVGLKALIRASLALHEQYLLNRLFLLCSSLEVTLGSVSLDAHVVQKSTSNLSGYLTGLLETWRGQLRQRPSWRLGGGITEDEAIHMVSFHFRTVAAMAKYFIGWTLDELGRQTRECQGASETQPEPSNTEWQRCLRAAYRFQLLCQVSGPTIPALRRKIAISNATSVLLAREPWEVKELFSFFQFAQTAYVKVFDDIESEAHPDSPRVDDQDRPPAPEGAFEFHNPCK